MDLLFQCESCSADIIVQYLKPGETAQCKSCLVHLTVPDDANVVDEQIHFQPRVTQIQFIPAVIAWLQRSFSRDRGLAKYILLVLSLCFVGSLPQFFFEYDNYADSIAGHLGKDQSEITQLDTYWHTFWWAVETFTTVSYGDISPASHLGKLFGLIFMIAGYVLILYNLFDMTRRLRHEDILVSGASELVTDRNDQNDSFKQRPVQAEDNISFLFTDHILPLGIDQLAYKNLKSNQYRDHKILLILSGIMSFFRRYFIARYVVYSVSCIVFFVWAIFVVEYDNYAGSVAGHLGKDQSEITQLDTLWHVIWWAIPTFATSGYGDISPASHLGKLIAMILMLAGYFITLSILATGIEIIRKGIFKRFQDELNDARKMQTSLFPKTAPEVKGIQVAGKSIPAKEVGGDFFDYIVDGDETKVGVAIGDVSGKGLRGAMNAVMASGILQLSSKYHVEPHKMMSEVNVSLCQKMEQDMNVTMVLAQFDIAKRQMTLANAGQHAYPLLIRNGTVESVTAKGLALGMIPNIPYKSTTIDVEFGDLLLFMTDGITEPRDADGVMYEESGRLNEVLSSIPIEMSTEEVVDMLINDVMDYTVDDEQDDDITLVAVRVSITDQPVSGETGLINVNTCSQEELVSLSGIGLTQADRIIAARPYERVDDLVKARGIGQAKLDRIR